MPDSSQSSSWEHTRSWSLVRPFVYYQRENLVSGDLIEGRDVVDYSAGLGDLSAYVSTLNPSSLLATVPEADGSRPPALPGTAQWVAGVGASEIADLLPARSADVILARMVIQFPTVEQHDVDVDSILEQMGGVLRVGASLVITTHAFFSLPQPTIRPPEAEGHLAAVEAHVQPLLQSNDDFVRRIAEEAIGLIELVRYLDLPPRESPFGVTGFGLKIPMLVNSFVRQGYTVESIEVIEPFTFPVGIQDRFTADPDSVIELGNRVMSIKSRYLTSEGVADPYLRPAILAGMLGEIEELVPVTAVPIVRLHATKK